MDMSVLMCAVALHAVCAALLLQRQALRVCNWRLAYAHALAGQLAISGASLPVGLLVIALVTELGAKESLEVYALGLFAAVLAWSYGLHRLTVWLGQNAKGSFYSPATLRRISLRSFLHLLGWYGAAAALAFALWRWQGPL
jgi:hypothetical protein